MHILHKHVVLIAFCSCAMLSAHGQQQKYAVDTLDFRDAAHHWYDIRDKGNIINPRPGHPRYPATNVEEIADNIILYQKTNGGWPKNYDMQAVLSQEQKDSLFRARREWHTNFDNGTTYAQIDYLSKANGIVPKEKYRAAIIKGLNFVLDAQYLNGGWPQYYPLENNYSRCITFNDGAYIGIMEMLKRVADENPDYSFLEPVFRKKLVSAYEKGIGCILKTQIVDNGKRTAWCQQYNEVTLEPAWARKFEPPSICDGESADIVLFLMSIPDPSAAVKDAVRDAVRWFHESEIHDTKIKVIDAPPLVTPYMVSLHDRVVINSPGAPPIWTRYYELKTHRPLFCNRDSKVVYSLAEVDRERRDGYGWYTYAPQKVLDHYPAWAAKNKVD